jgi:cytochrome c-type biogenesis protein CcmH
MTAPLPEAPAPRPSARLLIGLCACVIGLAVAGYAWKGSPGLKPVAAVPVDAEEQAARKQIEGMVDKLAQRLKEKPDDATGWLMLGRSYSVLGRFDDALPAYAKAVALRGNDASTLADYADALALKNGGQATPETDALVARALAVDPKHLKALALAGTSAFERADYAGAVRHWETMAQGLPPDSPDTPRLQASLAEARKRGGIAATPSLATAAAASAPTTAVVAAAGTSVSGTVTLAPALAAKASPTDTVFIYARAAQGPRMPLAVFRAQVKDLPITYTLDDSMAMAPTAKISGAAQVIVSARISKSGNAIPQPGDLAGESAPVAPGASGIAITIGSTVRP